MKLVLLWNIILCQYTFVIDQVISQFTGPYYSGNPIARPWLKPRQSHIIRHHPNVYFQRVGHYNNNNYEIYSNPYGALQRKQRKTSSNVQEVSFHPDPPKRPRHFSLPSLSQVSETLGALNTLGKYFLKKTQSNRPPSQPIQTENPYSISSEEDEDHTPSSSIINEKIHDAHQSSNSVPLVIETEDEEKLGEALYTLGRNVLGKNVTDTLVPVVSVMNSFGKFLPPLLYRDGRIVLGTAGNINKTQNKGDVPNVVCTTPDGGPGKCLDLSGCPSLLLNLGLLRKSLCFKALFVPGVCCPDNTRIPESSNLIPQSPTTRPPPMVTKPYNPAFGSSELKPLETFNTQEDECGRVDSPSFRIVGGSSSIPGNWPWMAAIFLHGPKGTEFWCGGSVISKQYILTAAHCTKDQKQKSFTARQFSVRLGDYDLLRTDDNASPTVFRVTKIFAHPEFSGMGFYNDVALMKLDREVTYSRYIKPICLPEGRAAKNSFVGTFATVIGWGTDKYGGRENTALQEVKLPVWSNAECDKTYFQPITDIFLCAGLPAGGKDACQGDSGGPLMLELETGKWTQIGIVSFGNRCAEPGYPGVYTRLTKFTDWIKQNAI